MEAPTAVPNVISQVCANALAVDTVLTSGLALLLAPYTFPLLASMRADVTALSTVVRVLHFVDPLAFALDLRRLVSAEATVAGKALRALATAAAAIQVVGVQIGTVAERGVSGPVRKSMVVLLEAARLSTRAPHPIFLGELVVLATGLVASPTAQRPAGFRLGRRRRRTDRRRRRRRGTARRLGGLLPFAIRGRRRDHARDAERHRDENQRT
jgi:hypothetical protein